MKLTDIELLILTRTVGNLNDTRLAELVNTQGGDSRVDKNYVDSYSLYVILKEELEARGINYSKGTCMKPVKIEGVYND